MRTQTRGSSEVLWVGRATPRQRVTVGRRTFGVMAFCALAAGGSLGACTVSRGDADEARGGQSDVGSAGGGGALVPSGTDGGSRSGGPGRQGGMGGVAGVAAGGAAGGLLGGGDAGADNPSMDDGLGGSAGEFGGLAPGAAAPSYFHAGTRLKPRVLRGGGLEVLDSRTESSWYDTQTGESCLFRKGADGVERCFPSAGSNDLTVYRDSACTKPVFVGSNLRCDGTAFNYISYGAYDGTDCTSVTYKLGAALPQSVPLYSNAADSCSSMGTSNNVRPLEKVPAETFVAVQRVSQSRVPQMNAWVREGADGSWEVTAFHDPIRNAACSGLGLASSSDACVPNWIEPTFMFADSSCTRRVAYDDRDKCGGVSAPVALLEKGDTGDACGASTTINGLWEIAADHPAQFFASGPGGCESSSVGSAKTYVQGAPIDVASLPRLEIIQVGTGSLRLPYYGFDKVPFFPVRDAPFLEAASGDSCQPYAFADGISRCVSSRYRLVADYDLYYKSADCSGDLVHPWFNVCPGMQRDPVGIIIRPFGCAQAVTETLEFEGTVPTEGGLFHPTPWASCQDSGFVAKEGSKWFRATKAVNPPDRFIPFELTVGD